VDKLMLLMPAAERRENIEPEIIASLKEQFHQRYLIFRKRENKVLRKGLLMVLCGTLLMSIDAFIMYKG
jgi:hypothetical protein